MSLNENIVSIIVEEVGNCNRSDLFRSPICAFSSADDERYNQLKTIIGDWHCNPNELLTDAKTVISFFVPFTKNVVKSAKVEEPVSAIWGEAYVVVNDLFNIIGVKVGDYLETQGFSAMTIAATHTYDPEKLQSMWSHRSAAAISGLGSFGANRLIITEKGSAGRFCTILTSADLEISMTPAEEQCLYNIKGTCLACERSCPVQALKVDTFEPFVCHEHLLNNEGLLHDVGFCDVCGKCIAYCPKAFTE